MDVVVIFDIVSTLAFGAALLYSLRIPRDIMARPTSRFLSISLGIYVFVSLSNVLEHGGVTDYLDRYEDFAEILFLPFFFFFLYSHLTALELEKRLEAERAYRAYVFSVADGLRNPLQIFKSYLEVFDRSNFTEEQETMFRKIQDATRRVEENIRELTEEEG
jgi:hypothetical protein